MKDQSRTVREPIAHDRSREEDRKPKRPGQRGRATRYPGIRRLDDGSFWVRARARDTKTRKWRSKEGIVEAVMIQDALREQDAWREELLAERAPAAARLMTLSACAKQWLEASARSGDARSTLDHKVDGLEHHILPVIGEHILQRLDRRDLREWVLAVSERRKRDGKPYGEETVLGWWRTLQAMIHWAVDELDLPSDPTSCFDPRRYMHKDLRKAVQAEKGVNALTPEELRRFLAVAKAAAPQHYAMFVVGFFTGMRWSELTALRFDDFSLKTMEIEVRRSQYRGTVRERTKNRRRRGPAFDPWMWSVVQEHRQRMLRDQAPGVDSGLCFPSEKGGIRYQSVLDKPLALICEKAGIPKKLSSKVFRRTFNDLARKAGMNELVKLAMVGHSDRRMSEVYSSIDPSEKQTELAKVVKLTGVAGS